MNETSSELLARLRPALEEIFAAYGISQEQARQVLEETLLLLISKRWDRQDPGRWLLRTVVEKCRLMTGREEEE